MPKPILAAMIILGVVATAGCRRLHEALPVQSVPDRVPEALLMTYRELDAEFQRIVDLFGEPHCERNEL